MLTRENTHYGIDNSNPDIYEVRATGEDLFKNAEAILEPAAETSELDELFEKLKGAQSVVELGGKETGDKSRSASERLEQIKSEIVEIKAFLDELRQGKDNLIKLTVLEQGSPGGGGGGGEVTRLEDVKQGDISKLSDTAREELMNLMKIDEMSNLVRHAEQEVGQLEANPDYQLLFREPAKVLAAAIEQLMSQVQRVTVADDPANVEVYTTTSQSVGVEDLVQLNERVSELEKIVGITNSSRLKYAFTDMPSALCQITQQLLLLDPKRVSALQAKAANLSKEYERLSAFLSNYGDYEKRIESLYANLNRWVGFSHALPKLIDKMKHMSLLAMEVRSMSGRLSSMEEQVEGLEALLSHSNENLDNLAKVTNEYLDRLRGTTTPPPSATATATAAAPAVTSANT